MNLSKILQISKEVPQAAEQLFSRKGEIDRDFVEGIREKVSLFLRRGPLEESIVIFDGPGLGCSSSMVVLALLGWERVRRLKAVHAVSAGGYAVLMFYGLHKGAIRLNRAEFEQWNKANQSRHGIGPLFGIFRPLSNLARLRTAFDGALLSGPVTHTLTAECTSQGIEMLPENLFFWTYNQTKRCLTPIHARSEEFQGMTIRQVMQAVAAVPYLYEPFSWRGNFYQDGFYAPDLKDHYQQWRGSSVNALFCHMNYEGEKGKTLFLKMHQNGSGYARVIIDFLYFISGIDNPEFVAMLRFGLFDVKPIEG